MANRTQQVVMVGDIVTYRYKKEGYGKQRGLVIKIKEDSSRFGYLAWIVPTRSGDDGDPYLKTENFRWSLHKVAVDRLELDRIGKYSEFEAASAANKLRIDDDSETRKTEKERARTVAVAKGLDSLKEGDKLMGQVYYRGTPSHQVTLEFVCVIKSSNRIRCRWAGYPSGKTKSWHPDDLSVWK